MALKASNYGLIDAKRVPVIIAMLNVIHDKDKVYEDRKGNQMRATDISFEVVDSNGNEVAWTTDDSWFLVD